MLLLHSGICSQLATKKHITLGIVNPLRYYGRNEIIKGAQSLLRFVYWLQNRLNRSCHKQENEKSKT
jgi:hypothetical protein